MIRKLDDWYRSSNTQIIERSRKWWGGINKTVGKNYPKLKDINLKIKRTPQVLSPARKARFPSGKVDKKFQDTGSTEKS